MTVETNWTIEEESTVAAYWLDHGSNWPGWREVLPTREIDAINAKARQMGMRRPKGGMQHPSHSVPKVCPFCGEYPAVAERHDAPNGRRRWYVQCNNARCYASAFSVGDTRESALAHWNRRAGE